MNRRAGLALGWAWVAAVIYLSLTPSPPKVDFEGSDKAGHLFAYALLAFWFCLFYPDSRTRFFYMAGFVSMGIALEFVQLALGYRSFELADMAANTLGVAAGWAGAVLLPLGWSKA
jgi:VanZ family protein